MLLSISKSILNGNPLLILLISLVFVVSSYDDSPYTRSAELLIPSQEEIEDLSYSHDISGKADPFCDIWDVTGVLLASDRHAETAVSLSEDRSPVLSSPVYATLHAYRAPPRLN